MLEGYKRSVGGMRPQGDSNESGVRTSIYEGGVPEEPHELIFGGVNVVQRGGDLTIITVGATLYKAVEAAAILKEKYGMEAEIINLSGLFLIYAYPL